MNRFFKFTSLLVLWLICAIQFTFGQGISKKRDYSGFFDSYYYRGPLSITIGGGTALYRGEVAKGFFGKPGLDLSLGVNYKIWPRTMFGLDFNYLTLAASKGDSTGAAFTGTDWGLNLYGRLYLIEDIIRKAKDRKSNRKVKPYIVGGIGFVKYKAVHTLSGASAGLTPTFPVGLGMEFKISPKLQVMPEFVYTFTLNDRLDASTIKKGKDSYTLMSLKIQYSPFAPKKKKKFSTAPADPNLNREEHQEWRKKKKEEPKPEEYKLPGEENSEEQPTDSEENPDENTEENPDGNPDENTEENPEENTEEPKGDQ